MPQTLHFANICFGTQMKALKPKDITYCSAAVLFVMARVVGSVQLSSPDVCFMRICPKIEYNKMRLSLMSVCCWLKCDLSASPWLEPLSLSCSRQPHVSKYGHLAFTVTRIKVLFHSGLLHIDSLEKRCNAKWNRPLIHFIHHTCIYRQYQYSCPIVTKQSEMLWQCLYYAVYGLLF